MVHLYPSDYVICQCTAVLVTSIIITIIQIMNSIMVMYVLVVLNSSTIIPVKDIHDTTNGVS